MSGIYRPKKDSAWETPPSRNPFGGVSKRYPKSTYDIRKELAKDNKKSKWYNPFSW